MSNQVNTMGRWWLRFGCLLTGYKYSLLIHCSSASERALIKYTSALLLVCLIWGFVGFAFTQHYLHAGVGGGIAGSVILIFAVIQIERQIILALGKHRMVAIFRIIIGLVIAIIGSIIIDQILFSEDIKIQKDINTRTKVIADLDSQMVHLETEISTKEAELTTLFEKFKKDPTVPAIGYTESTYVIDTTGGRKGRRIMVGGTQKSQSVENPIGKNIPLVQAVIDTLRKKQFEISSRKTKIIAGGKVDEDANDENRNGFLDELAVMKTILFSRNEAIFVWGLFFIFFLSIELFILFNKFYDKENDYEHLVSHQMDIRIEQLKALNRDKII